MYQVGDDRKPEPPPGHLFVQAFAAARRLAGQCRRHPRAVIFDRKQETASFVACRYPDAAVCPLAGVFQQIAEYFFKIFTVATEGNFCGHVDIDGHLLVGEYLGQRARDAFGDEPHGHPGTEHPSGPRDRRCAPEVMLDQTTHRPDLFCQHTLVGRPLRFDGDHRKRRFQSVGQVADMGARPFDQLRILVEDTVHGLGERGHLAGIAAGQSPPNAYAHRLQVSRHRAQWPQAVLHLNDDGDRHPETH